MEPEPLRFKKSSRSGGQSECIEVAHTLSAVRDSKSPDGAALRVDVRGLLSALRDGRL